MRLPFHTDPILQHHFENEDWLRDLFDQAHDLIHLVHPDGTLLYVNHAWSSLLGYRLEEVQGRSIYDFIDPAHRQEFVAYRTALLEGSVIKHGLVINLMACQGHSISVEGIVSVKYTADGKPLYTRGIFRDITQKLKAEAQLTQFHQELLEREQNLHQLLIHAPDAVIVIDQESSITFWNPKAEEIFGWSKEEVLGKPLSQTIVPPQHREGHDRGMKRYLSTGEAHVLNRTIEITSLNKSGREFYVSLTISKTTQKGEVAFIAFLRDIQEQKANQLELERKTMELERSNNNLEEFAHAASHDLKEPIRKVQTFASRLKETLLDKMTDTEKGYFERMEIATRRMGLLVDDLLEYSHVSQGASDFQVIDLDQCLHTVVEDLEVPIHEKAAHITIGKLPQVQGHKRQLQQLFQNLLSNALKYTRPGVPPEITITATQVRGDATGLLLPAEAKEQWFHCIQVADNGIGFEQKNADQIFKMFQRLHGKAEYSGTGVGLSIVRKVVENLQGYIKAEGVPDQGATFSVYLPVTI